MSGPIPNIDTRPRLRWPDVAESAEGLFSIWMAASERAWARVAWEHLEAADLTSYENQVERTRVLTRLVALAAFYHSWCRAAWQSGFVEPRQWAVELQIIPFRVAQLVGDEFCTEPDWADEELYDEAFRELFSQEYERIVPILSAGFGSDGGLFTALWLSREPEWSGRAELPDDVAWDAVNDITDDKMCGYRWIVEGCQVDDFD